MISFSVPKSGGGGVSRKPHPQPATINSHNVEEYIKKGKLDTNGYVFKALSEKLIQTENNIIINKTVNNYRPVFYGHSGFGHVDSRTDSRGHFRSDSRPDYRDHLRSESRRDSSGHFRSDSSDYSYVDSRRDSRGHFRSDSRTVSSDYSDVDFRTISHDDPRYDEIKEIFNKTLKYAVKLAFDSIINNEKFERNISHVLEEFKLRKKCTVYSKSNELTLKMNKKIINTSENITINGFYNRKKKSETNEYTTFHKVFIKELEKIIKKYILRRYSNNLKVELKTIETTINYNNTINYVFVISLSC